MLSLTSCSQAPPKTNSPSFSPGRDNRLDHSAHTLGFRPKKLPANLSHQVAGNLVLVRIPLRAPENITRVAPTIPAEPVRKRRKAAGNVRKPNGLNGNGTPTARHKSERSRIDVAAGLGLVGRKRQRAQTLRHFLRQGLLLTQPRARHLR